MKRPNPFFYIGYCVATSFNHILCMANENYYFQETDVTKNENDDPWLHALYRRCEIFFSYETCSRYLSNSRYLSIGSSIFEKKPASASWTHAPRVPYKLVRHLLPIMILGQREIPYKLNGLTIF